MLEPYAHPFSSYCWKVMTALYERGIPFEYRMLDQEHPENFCGTQWILADRQVPAAGGLMPAPPIRTQ